MHIPLASAPCRLPIPSLLLFHTLLCSNFTLKNYSLKELSNYLADVLRM